MIRWTAEADTHRPALQTRNNETSESSKRAVPQRQRDDLYGVHNFIVLDDLLKRHLHLK